MLLVGLAASLSPHVLCAQAGQVLSRDSLPSVPRPVAPDPGIDAPSEVIRQHSVTSVTVHADSAPVSRAIIHAEAEREIKLEETQRIAVVVPNFNTVVSGEGVPLDVRQKLDLAWHTTIDPFNPVGSVVLAGLSEIQGTHRGFGWGPGGYARRAGAQYADIADATMLAGAVYPILLHQDPRYFRQGTAGFASRLRHALLAPVLCRGDDGRTQLNASNVLGNFTAGVISNAYYPAGDRGVGLTALNSTIVTAEGALGNIAMEFSPDVQNYLRRGRQKRAAHIGRAQASDIASH